MLSVIIPVFNCERYIEKCLLSVVSQDYRDIEIIIVDDGSTDNSIKIIKAIQENDSRIKIYTKNNAGPNSARKMAIAKSCGEYVFFLDADDYIENGAFSKMMDIAYSNKADIVTCSYKKIFNDGSVCNIQESFQEGLYSGKEIAEKIIDVEKFYTSNGPMALWAHVIKKELIIKYLQKIDNRIYRGEDRIIWFAYYDAPRVYMLKEAFYAYRINELSITRQHFASDYENIKLQNQYVLSILKEKNMDKMFYEMNKQFVIRDLMLGGYKEAFCWLDFLYPYKGVLKGSKVVIYGAGIFGQELYEYITSTNEYELVAVLDKNWESIGIKGNHRVQAPNVIKQLKFDYIVVAVAFYYVSINILNELLLLGVDKNKIKVINTDLIDYKYVNPSFFE